MRNRGGLTLLSACLLAGGLLVFTMVKAAATTLYVGGNDPACTDAGSGTADQPFCTISQAALAAQAGQTVQVASGTYAEDVTPAHSGMAGSPIIFAAAPGAHVIVTGKPTGSNGFSISGKRYITIKGFTISGTARHGVSATSGCSFLTIIGNHITGAGRSANPSTVEHAISLASATHSLIENNVIDHNTSSGVYLAADSHDNTVDHNIISFNASGYTDPAGVYHRLAPGIDVRGNANLISNNVSHDNDDSGIQLVQGASRNIVVNNVVYHNKDYPNRQAGDHGIDLSSAPDNTVVSNTVYDNVTAGINVEGASTGTTLANNISVHNGLPASPRTKGEIRVTSAAASGTTIDYDDIYLPNTTATIITWNDITFNSLAALHARYPDIEANGLQAKPGWISPSSGDFHLTENSPAIDSANSSAPGQLPYDQEGTPRRDDPNVDNTGAGVRTYDDRCAYEFDEAAREHRRIAGPGTGPGQDPEIHPVRRKLHVERAAHRSGSGSSAQQVRNAKHFFN